MSAAADPTAKYRDEWTAQRFRLGMLLRQSGEARSDVLGAVLDAVPRHQFLPPSFWAQAYENVAVPAGNGQTVSAPEIVCRMTSALEVCATHRVLEIGTGSGYQAAVLSHLCGALYSIERHETLAKSAHARLSALGADNISLFVGDGSVGLPGHAPFDRIILTAAPPKVPQALFDQLAVGGVLVAPVGATSSQQFLVRYKKVALDTGSTIETQVLGRVRFVPLVASMPHG